jgi:hypothetical protein
MNRAFAGILGIVLPPPEGGVPEDFIYRNTRGEAGWIQRNREMITEDMAMVALRDRFNLQIRAGGVVRDVANFEEARLSLRWGMGLEWLPGAVPPQRSLITITPDDLGSFLTEDIFNIMESRIRTADAPMAA